ncbi:MAG: bifunctional adenosylcobinamide kinase/adenosylcobinamide-phosphate guanylyltransferase [Candidatus Omnitrophota bacterium]|nr:bifunctional adenosylcobinamide kinase/adenosylcobinamide-phosphate guanylyltransferase [Candidatus Omnitrophota bacterium]
MKKNILIFGGARSGKSSLAVNIAKRISKKVVFIATALPGDEEMRKRIKKHRASRPRHWKVVEDGKDIHHSLLCLDGKCEAVIIDCLGLFIANLMGQGLEDNAIMRKIKYLVDGIQKTKFMVIIVSNDVGGGIVPDNQAARRFRDLLGSTNQLIAKEADEVVMMQAGIPLIIKGEKRYAVTE